MTSTDEHRQIMSPSGAGEGQQKAEFHALALDLGSSSVRAVLGSYRQGVVSTEEVFRLHHQAVDDHGTLTWDLERIMDGVRRSIAMATQRLGRAPDSIGIDTWGVDYGLLDAQGELLHAPRAYRDRAWPVGPLTWTGHSPRRRPGRRPASCLSRSTRSTSSTRT